MAGLPSAWRMYDNGKLAILDKAVNMATDAFKVALFTSSYTPNLVTDDLYSGLTGEVSSTNTGYTTAGISITPSALSAVNNTFAWTTATAISWTAGSAGIIARTVVIYHVATSKLICYCLLDVTPADVVSTPGNPFVILPNASGILTFGGAVT
jgi:hypothetical protein